MSWLRDRPQNFIFALEASRLGQYSFFGQSLSREHYQPIYQPPEGVYLQNNRDLINQSERKKCNSRG